jgi:hypothetical protein
VIESEVEMRLALEMRAGLEPSSGLGEQLLETVAVRWARYREGGAWVLVFSVRAWGAA